MTKEFSAIIRYTPYYLQERLRFHIEPLKAPEADDFEAAVLFCDIAGFSKITEQITKHDPDAISDLVDLLDDYLGSLVNMIIEKGGDVVKFAGDALFAMWPANKDNNLTAVVCQAMRCAMFIKRKMNNFKAKQLKSKNVVVNIRLGIGAGKLSVYHIGGIFDRWELLFTGEAMRQASKSGTRAKGQELVISRPVRKILERKHGLQKTPEDHILKVLPRFLNTRYIPIQPKKITAVSEKALRAYIPRAILSRIDEGLNPRLAELRQVSVIFLKVLDFRFSESSQIMEIQPLMEMMQRCLYKYEGSVNRFGFDDKGAVLLAAFGLPPFEHEDIAYRAVMASLHLRDVFHKNNLECVIGIGTGPVFCGSVGSIRRSEYTMHGSIVNLAAGLMQASSSILCEEKTYQRAKEKVEFKAMEPVPIKGRRNPVRVYSPI